MQRKKIINLVELSRRTLQQEWGFFLVMAHFSLFDHLLSAGLLSTQLVWGLDFRWTLPQPWFFCFSASFESLPCCISQFWPSFSCWTTGLTGVSRSLQGTEDPTSKQLITPCLTVNVFLLHLSPQKINKYIKGPLWPYLFKTLCSNNSSF